MVGNDKNQSQHKYNPSLFDHFIVFLPEAYIAYSMHFCLEYSRICQKIN